MLAVMVLIAVGFLKAEITNENARFLIRSKDVNSADYQQALVDTHLKPLVDGWMEFAERTPTPVEVDKVLSLAINGDCRSAFDEVETALVERSRWPISTQDREVFLLLYRRMEEVCGSLGERTRAAEQAKKFTSANSGPRNGKRSKAIGIMREIEQTEDQTDGVILVQGQSWYLLQVLPNEKYQWTLLTNSSNPLVFFGTWLGFQRAVAGVKFLVSGACGRQQPRELYSELWGQTAVMFARDCILDLRDPTAHERISGTSRYSSMYKRDESNWIWTTAIAVVAIGLGSYALKDKQLTIHGFGLTF